MRFYPKTTYLALQTFLSFISTHVCFFAFAAAEIQTKKLTCHGGRSAGCFTSNNFGSLDLMKSEPSKRVNDELFSADIIRNVLALYHIYIINS